jgi:TP53 regulating kinase-like protein
VVPIDPGRVRRWLESLRLLGAGAEAEVRLGDYAGYKAVFKYRLPKRYRHPKLDSYLRTLRTKREARLLLKARSGGLPVPAVLAVYPTLGLLVIEYIEGELLRERLRRDPRGSMGLVVEAGRILARLHSLGIVHGDSTTSNYIVSPSGLYLIDFGLADSSQGVEERAVDVHLFRRSLESAHASIAGNAFKSFLDGYLSEAGEWGERVVRRAEEIRLMGRYVAERRTVWRGGQL